MSRHFRSRFKTSHDDLWESAAFKLRGLFLVLTLLLPACALMFMAYDTTVTRYVARNVVQSGSSEAGLPSDQVVAVVGQLDAKPVQLPAGYPQFQNALMVVELHQHYKRGKHGGWKTTRRFVWISERVTLGAWELDPRLIENAKFIWHRASPCTQYDPGAGWVANCEEGYAYREGDDNLRYSYEITLIPEGRLTIVAAASGEKLTTIEHHLSAPPADLVFWTDGTPNVSDWLRQQLTRQAAWSVFWAVLWLLGVWWQMYVVIRRVREEDVLPSLAGGFWRAVITVSPLAAVAWPFDGPGFMAAAALSALASAAIGFAFWFHVKLWFRAKEA
jgi:hypothetical protein